MNRPVPTQYRQSWGRADAPQRPVLFINPRSGGGRAGGARLAEAARERDIEPVVLEPGDDLGALAEDAAADGADVLGTAGGDGSLAIVASAAGAHGIPFVCVPAGTRNHFARDLGLDPDDLVGALDAFTDALEGSIDLGDVNDRLARRLRGGGAAGELIAVRKRARSSRRRRRCWVQARRCPGCAWSIPP